MLEGKDIISIHDLSKETIEFILKTAAKLENPQPLLAGKTMASLFFEPSTRTRLSFESAMTSLGGKVIGFSDKDTTSIAKGETLWDAIKVVDNYADLIVMRHPLEGAARLASEAATVPVINGGDGANQHPTQTLLDLYTILQTQKTLDKLHVVMVGDLKYGRTVHSLAIALSHFNCTLSFVAPKSLQMPKEICDYLKEKKISFAFYEKIEDVIDTSDIVYITRIQKERFPDDAEYEKVKNLYILKKGMLENVKKTMRILHPLPRVNEITKDIDSTEHAYYFDQAKNGIVVRRALIALVLGVL